MRTLHLLTLAALSSARLPAQEPGVRSTAHSAIIGRVIDEQRAPIQGAEVALREAGVAVTTNDSGRFVLRDLPAASYHIVVRRVGYESVSMQANLAADDTLVADNIRLTRSSAQQLPTVNVRDRGTNPDLADFERRRTGGAGKFITSADLAKVYGAPLSNVLKDKAPGIQRVGFPACGGRGMAIAGAGSGPIQTTLPGQVAKAALNLGPPRCFLPDLCYMQVVVDGVRIYSYGSATTPPNLDAYQTFQIEAIEIYPRGGDTPAEFNSTGSDCGTIVIWSKR